MILAFVVLLQFVLCANGQNFDALPKTFQNGVNVFSNSFDAGMDVTQQWIKFQADFVKNYTATEIPRRFEIFKRNLQKIQEHNQKFLQGLNTFKIALNKFADLTKEEFVETLKLKPPRRYKRNVDGKITKKNSRTKRQLPDSVDWRNVGAVTPVKNQGNCGSCWSFTAIGALEGQVYLKTGQSIPLSEQHLIDCNIDMTNMGCTGGWISNAYDYLRSNFVTSEFEYPYQETQQICKKEGAYNTRITVTGYQLLSGTEDALKEAVASIGPIATALDGSNLQFYDGGVYRDEDCAFSNKVNHGVVVIGYGSESGKDYWLVKNSWGSDWGENGYFKIMRNYQNQCNLATYAMYPTLG